MKTYSSKGSESTALRANSESVRDLRQLFEIELKDIYWAEKALTKAIPKQIDNVTSRQLAEALREHLQTTYQQVTRLENVFEAIRKNPEAKKCQAMEGLIRESDYIMGLTEQGVVRDAGIIAATQKIEHYEIATYGTLKSFADILGEYDVATLLEETLDEEKDEDAKLTEIAESGINFEATTYNIK